MVDLPDSKLGCHHTGFLKSCRKLVVSGSCNRWMHIQGIDPLSAAVVDRADCIDNWTPSLLIENSKLQRETGAAVESFRNSAWDESQKNLKDIVDTVEHQTSFNTAVLHKLGDGLSDMARAIEIARLPAPLVEQMKLNGKSDQ